MVGGMDEWENGWDGWDRMEKLNGEVPGYV